MNQQSGSSWQIVFTLQNEECPLFDEFMEKFFQVSACNYTETGQIEHVGYTSAEPNETDMCTIAAQYGLTLPAYRIEFIPAANWLTKNVIRFPPLETADFYIYGSHEENIPDTSKHMLKIYAATAFGSGQHQTTGCCIELLSRLYHNNFCPQKILDMGCGSGILALSALKLWNGAKAVAADIDNEAIIVTLQNAADNELEQQITAAAGDGYNNSVVLQNAPYDLIFSNILARPLIEMASSLSNALKPGGFAILSGFIDEQTEWVLDAHRHQGLKLVDVISSQNWRAALMEKTNESE